MAEAEFAEEIACIYADLLARQEPLGEEFDAVLTEGLEELYEA